MTQQEGTLPPSHLSPSSKRKKILLLSVKISLFIGLALCLVTGGFIAGVLVGDYEIDEAKLLMTESTKVFDRHHQEVYRLATHHREYVPIEQIPKQLQEAFIAVEDQRFYQHQGFDLRAIARALYRDILARSMVEGGSTITQQLAKNVFLTHEKNLMRKTEEVLIAINLEKRYGKEKILEMYLNQIYFGHGAYGVQAASQVYFGKQVQDLELAEMALLAALPKAPNHYTPFFADNKERSEDRRKLVLSIMEQQGLISSDERVEAVETSLVLQDGLQQSDPPALWTYIDMMIAEAEQSYGLSHDQLLDGGYQIYTTLDLQAQELMYRFMAVESEHSAPYFPPAGAERYVEGSMVILDQSSGAVIAVQGGREYVRLGLNRAVAETRQPGSTFKPIVAYAPALEQGWEPYTWLEDQLFTYQGEYTPRNYDHVYRGRVTMLEAVQHSYNAPAVWTLDQLGMNEGVGSAHAFEFPQVEEELGLGIVLGGGDFGVSPLSLAKAYAAFANWGKLPQPYLIEKIVSRAGEELVREPQEQPQIVSAQTAWYMTEMLQKVVEEGTGTEAQLHHPVAGKTGTTQAPEGIEGIRDAWFVGYTPQYTAAVWMGFDQVDEQHVLDSSGGRHPARLFQAVMTQLLEDEPVQPFEKPEGVNEMKPMTLWERLNKYIPGFLRRENGLDQQITPENEAPARGREVERREEKIEREKEEKEERGKREERDQRQGENRGRRSND